MRDYEVIIIGGGPGGMSALLWCQALDLRARLLERAPELGGQLLQMFHRVTDYPGLIAPNGRELRDRFEAHLREMKLEWRVNCRIEELDLRDRRLVCDGQPLSCQAIILALGARKRRLGVPGEAEFEGRGVSYSATRDHRDFAGREVCVVGGGDSAFENCLILARLCPRVTLIHRSTRFRARPAWVEQVRQHPRISVITEAEVRGIQGASQVSGVIIEEQKTGGRRIIPAEGVFIRIGMAPNTESVRGQLELDEDGFIKTDQRQRTSAELVYAAGDVCRPACLSVATAVGQGAVAAKDISEVLKGRPAAGISPDAKHLV
jgi:thioredoxin reductase (NADPH)